MEKAFATIKVEFIKYLGQLPLAWTGDVHFQKFHLELNYFLGLFMIEKIRKQKKMF